MPRGRALITLEGGEKVYTLGKVDYRALRGVDLEIARGSMVAVVGPSGSGKTTILNPITGIDRPTAGTVSVDGRRLGEMTEEQLAVWRGANVGITHDRELAARAQAGRHHPRRLDRGRMRVR